MTLFPIHTFVGKRSSLGALLAMAMFTTVPAIRAADAASEADLLREELRQLKADYEQRIQRMEERIHRMEAGSATVGSAPASTNGPAVSESAVVRGKGQTNAVTVARQFANDEFVHDTESRDRAARQEPGPFRDRVEQVLQDFVDITGYVRAGYGRSDEGGPQVGYAAPGAGAKYRLGNEPENYGELAFGKNWYVPGLFSMDPNVRPDGTPTGPIARTQVRMAFYNPYQDLVSASGTEVSFPEAWASIGNVVASQPSMKFWAGNRFYRRHDIHINDFYFYNMSGGGGGVEDIQLPFGKLALAWIGWGSSSGISDVPQPNPENEAGFNKNNWDLRLYDVPMFWGQAEMGLTLAHASSGQDSLGNKAPDSDGVAINFVHTREGFLATDGLNKFSLQFGTGAAKTFSSGFETFTQPSGVYIRPDEPDSWRFRVTENFTVTLDEHFSIGPALVYQVTDYGEEGGLVQWTSAGVRPIFHYNRYLSLALEGGVDWVKDDGAGTSDCLYKLTVAPQVSLGGSFMSRPVIRLFVTYAHWGDDFVGQVGGVDYASRNDGLTYGMQMEVWW